MPQTERSKKPVCAHNETIDDVACPFCGLLCDDLRISREGSMLTITQNGCLQSARGLRQAVDAPQASALVSGKASSNQDAVTAAAALLAGAKRPVMVCQGTDVGAARAILSLADRSGAALDHSHSAGLMRNLAVLQDRGWMTATLTEVRNRSDLIVIAGQSTFDLFPRLTERVMAPEHSLYLEAGRPRKIILLGPWDAASLPADVKALHPTLYHTPVESIGDVMAALRALMRGQPVQAFAIGGIPIQDLESLCAEFKAAHYLAIAWSAAEFDFPHADLAIQQIVECVRELNTTTRASALPLGGNRADMTLNQVCTWQSGTPVRTGFSRGIPHFDPLQGDYRKLLAEGEADVLLWYSALDPDAIPPETTAKLIVLGHPAMKLATKPAVFIPIGVPGIDHPGLFYRSDNVVSIPLKALRAPSNPPGSAILTAIGEALGTSPN